MIGGVALFSRATGDGEARRAEPVSHRGVDDAIGYRTSRSPVGSDRCHRGHCRGCQLHQGQDRRGRDASARADRGCTTSRAPWRSSWRGADLRLIARLIDADIGTRVFYARQPGYDTHSGQMVTHYSLLNDLGEALKALHDDLTAARLADRGR